MPELRSQSLSSLMPALDESDEFRGIAHDAEETDDA